MKEDYITFETALLAKETGFNWPVSAYYNEYTKMLIRHAGERSYQQAGTLSAPTQCFLGKWLREEKQLSIELYSFPKNKKEYIWGYDVCDLSMKHDAMVFIHGERGDNYYNDFENGLKEALKYLKKHEKID